MTGCFYLVMYREGHKDHCKRDSANSCIFLTEDEATESFVKLMTEMMHQQRTDPQDGEFYMDMVMLKLTSGELLPESIDEVINYGDQFDGLMKIVQMAR